MKALGIKSCSRFATVPARAGDFNKWLLSCNISDLQPEFQFWA